METHEKQSDTAALSTFKGPVQRETHLHLAPPPPNKQHPPSKQTPVITGSLKPSQLGNSRYPSVCVVLTPPHHLSPSPTHLLQPLVSFVVTLVTSEAAADAYQGDALITLVGTEGSSEKSLTDGVQSFAPGSTTDVTIQAMAVGSLKQICIKLVSHNQGV